MSAVPGRVVLAACICTVAAILFVVYSYRDRQLKTPAPAESLGKSESNLLPSTQAESLGKSESNLLPSTPAESLGKSESNFLSSALATPGLPIHHDQGYMLALSYYDQMTGGVANLKSLMCLAKKIGGVHVVEPFVTGSLLGLNLTAKWTKEVKMTDVLDYEVFKNSLPLDRFGELASFETFLQNTPRKLLMVQCCHAASVCRPCKDEGLISRTRVFCERNGLELVGVVCVNFEKEKMLDLTAVNTLLYSKYNKSEVVILFELYGGIPVTPNNWLTFRFNANIQECRRENSKPSIAAGRYVLSDANEYIRKYLNGSSYISLMIRMEMVFLQSRAEESQRPKVAKQCFDNLLQKLNDIGKRTGLKQIFLTFDIGRYGSEGFRHGSKIERAIEEHAGEFLSTIYGRNMSLTEWEERYISTCRLNNAGYIAIVQKQIAAGGEVLVLSGPASAYQESATMLYNKLHQKRQFYTLHRCK